MPPLHNSKNVVKNRRTLNNTTPAPALDKVFEYIEAHAPTWQNELLRLCRASDRRAATTAAFHRRNLTTRNLAQATEPAILFAEATSKKGTPNVTSLLCYGHYDTILPRQSAMQNRDPLQRPGSISMANLLARLAAFEAYRAVFGSLPCHVKFLVQGQGATDSAALTRVIAEQGELLTADSCLWTGGGHNAARVPLIGIGSKGNLSILFESTGPSKSINASYATVVGNPAWRLIWIAGLLKNDDEEIKFGEGNFYDNVNPSREERNLIKVLNEDDQALRQALGVTTFLNELEGPMLSRTEATVPTCNISSFVTYPQDVDTLGGNGAIIPMKARMRVDLRLVPEQNPAELFDQLKTFLAKRGFDDVSIELIGQPIPPAHAHTTAPIVGQLQRAVKVATGQDAQLKPLSNDGPVYFVSEQLAIPTAGLSIEAPGDRIAPSTESVDFAQFISLTRTIASLYHEIGQYLPDDIQPFSFDPGERVAEHIALP